LASGRNEVCQYVGPAAGFEFSNTSSVVKAQAAQVRVSREERLRRALTTWCAAGRIDGPAWTLPDRSSIAVFLSAEKKKPA